MNMGELAHGQVRACLHGAFSMNSAYIVKALYLSCIALAAAGTQLTAAEFFFSFDTQQSGTGPYTSVVTTNNGFLGTPVFTRGGSIGTPNMDGGATFTDFAGRTWVGSGGSGTPGHSSGWNNGSVGNAFAVTFSTVGLENITVRYDIRSAAQAGGTPPTSFTSFGYDLGNGLVEIPGSHMSFTANNQFNTWSIDLSFLDAIENQPSVKLRWAFEDLAVSPVESVRVDNIQVTAITVVPEPGSVALVSLGTALLGWTAWRRSRRER